MWYVEEKSLGKWWPQIYSEKPDKKTLSGVRIFRSDPVKVSPAHQGLTVNELQKIYGTRAQHEHGKTPDALSLSAGQTGGSVVKQPKNASSSNAGTTAKIKWW